MTKAEAKRFHLLCIVALFIAAIILGASFVAQKVGMEYVGAFTFNTLRSFIGCLALVPALLFADKFIPTPKNYCNKALLKGGLLAGFVLFIAFSINQYCMIYAEAGKAGFITALYILFVPVFSVFLGKKLKPNILVSVGVALVGLYLLCAKGSFSFELWDIFLMISAFFFAIHIMIVSHFSKRVSPFKLSALQFLVVGVLSLPLMILESPRLVTVMAGIKPILFIGVVVTGIAYTLQIFGQKAAPPVVTTLILSTESVFAVLFAMFFLGESLAGKEIVGCCLMALALIISQIKRR